MKCPPTHPNAQPATKPQSKPQPIPHQVTTASVIAAARACGLTELHLSELFASTTSRVEGAWREHAPAAFELGAHWATDSVLRDGGGAVGTAAGDKAEEGGEVAGAAVVAQKKNEWESWEWWLGRGDEARIRRALPQLRVLVVEP